MTPTPPDRAMIAATVMDDLLAIELDADDATVGAARVIAVSHGVVAGTAVAREIMARVGVRTRSIVPEGQPAAAGTTVLELGGSLAAIRGAAPLALTWLTRCGAVASGATPPEEGNPIDAYAARLSGVAAVGNDGPSFRLEIDRETQEGVKGQPCS